MSAFDIIYMYHHGVTNKNFGFTLERYVLGKIRHNYY